MTERLRFPDMPIDGRDRHAHRFNGDHGCQHQFYIEDHVEACEHFHTEGHLISIDSECGFIRGEGGTVVAMYG